MENTKKESLFIGVFLLAIFILAVVIWYSPVLFKGYNPYASTGFLLARNLHESGLYSTDNNLNITLSSNLIKDNGILSISGNKLTPLLYSKIFDVIGLPETNDLIFLSIFIHALTLLIFTVLILYLFNFKTALIFSLIYIFLPFNWQLPYSTGVYEFALLFLSLFFLLFFYGLKNKYSYIYLPIAGIFLILACLFKEALFLIAPFLLLFLWFKKQKKSLFYIFIPFVIILSIFWLPNITNNLYLRLFISDTSNKEIKSADLHLYPDPYTYHFEQEEFLTDFKNTIDNNEMVLIDELVRIKELKNKGVADISLFNRMRVGLVISSRHIFRFISLEDIGGSFIFLLILLGLYSLRQKNRYLYQFFIYWITSAIFLMSFIILAVRNHLMDFNWAIALLISLGLMFLIKLISDYFDLKKKKQVFLYITLLFILIYHFVLVNHIAWSRIYDDSGNLMVQSYSREIKKMDIADKDVIAISLGQGATFDLNYLTNKSIVTFRPETIENLITKDKLNFALNEFGVKYILGYSDKLSEDILNKIDVINIASDSLEPIIPELSRNKSWFMNLIK